MKTMPTVVTTDTDAARKSASSITRSFTRRSRRCARRSLTKCSDTASIPGACVRDVMILAQPLRRSELRFELHQLFDREPDFVLPVELGACTELPERFH